jgi:nucleoporin NUP82
VISPQGDFLAILTAHTVHICLLPDPTHLTAPDISPMKPRHWTLGPTIHVTSRAAVASALWHPLGVNGTALVTVTQDAVVRLWELSADNKWSFDAPTLAIDLKKLADGTALDQDFSASSNAKNGFSPDSFDMEVAAACFGGRKTGGWSPMTLWVAMRGGDVYALCPLLPQRWAPPPSLIPSLAVSIVAKNAALGDDLGRSGEKQLAEQQVEWMADIDDQEPRILDTGLGEEPVEVYNRPSNPGSIPKLQGPFEMEQNDDTEDDLDMELTDIYVIGQKIESEELMDGEEADLETDGDGLSLPVVCLISTSGQLKVCLSLEEVEARWLPRTKTKSAMASEDDDTPSLLVFQLFDILRPAEVIAEGWPMFSDDVTSRYSFFITHSSGITHVSLSSWVFRLEAELQAPPEPGSDFRMDVLFKASTSDLTKVFTQDAALGSLAAVVAMQDPDLGHFALSATQSGPVAISFESTEVQPPRLQTTSTEQSEELAPQPEELWQPRPVFQAPGILGQDSGFPAMIESLRGSKYGTLLKQPLRPDNPTLSLLMDIHRVLAAEVKQLNPAVAELFRKCETLKAELEGQIARANQVKSMVDIVSGNTTEGEPVSDNQLVQQRLRDANLRRDELARRVDALKARLGKAASRELSDKERAWVEEVQAVEANVGPMEDTNGHSGASGRNKHLAQRLQDVESLKEELSQQVEQLRRDADDTMTKSNGTGSPRHEIHMNPAIRKAKMEHVRALLERESALVEAVKGRLERLSVG